MARKDKKPAAKPTRKAARVAAPAPPKPHPAKPIDYDPSFCAVAVSLGKQGKSRTQIAVAIGVTRRKLNKWTEVHAEFADACELADDHAQAFFEDLGVKGLALGHRFNDRTWWNMVRCRFSEHYRDAKEFELSGSFSGEPVKLVIAAAEEGV